MGKASSLTSSRAFPFPYEPEEGRYRMEDMGRAIRTITYPRSPIPDHRSQIPYLTSFDVGSPYIEPMMTR